MHNVARLLKPPISIKVYISAAVLIIAAITIVSIFVRSHRNNLLEPPLKTLAAKHGIELGNFAIQTKLHDPAYSTILSTQFNLALIDNTPNWYFTDGGLRPSPSKYNFSGMDAIVLYAQAHAMAIQAHHLLWGEDKWLPGWLKNGDYTQAQLMSIIHDDIATTVARYKGKIQEWSVVNEAFTRNLHVNGLHDWWADRTGSQAYIDQAFMWAHQADPGAKLLLNDFDNEHFNPVSDAMYAYIKDAKTRGVPIDGIGMQMHIDGTHPPDEQEVIQNMQRFGAIGVAVYVTEFDVNMSAVSAPGAVRDQIESQIYFNMMRACIESKVCHSFSVLGVTDSETWYDYMGRSTQDARPLLFDANYKAKPAYYSFRAALQQP